jgi:hypothetical protein
VTSKGEVRSVPGEDIRVKAGPTVEDDIVLSLPELPEHDGHADAPRLDATREGARYPK